MLNSVAISILILIAITVILVSIAIPWKKTDHYNEWPCVLEMFATIIAVVVVILTCISFCYPLEPHAAGTITADNDNREPIKINYVQYHMYTEPTLESTVLLPGQIKLINHAHLINKVKFNYATDSL